MMIDSLSRNMKRGQYQKDSVLFFFCKDKEYRILRGFV